MIAPINKIIDFSTVDGNGLRTSIFFQGCNISCLYCHNPETQRLCSNCFECVSNCKSKALSIKEGKVSWNKELCINCDTCLNVCKNYSSPKISYLSVEEVFNHVLGNVPFIRGITVSGGECMLYPSFLKELFTLAKENNLHTLLDSNGMVLYEEHKDLMDLVDGVMLDVKSFDDKVYQKLTGYHNDNVKRNLVWLHNNHKLEEIRIVYVKDYVDAKACIKGIKELLNGQLDDVNLKLITFRPIGVKSILSNHKSPSKEEMDELYNYALELGYKNIVIK